MLLLGDDSGASILETQAISREGCCSHEALSWAFLLVTCRIQTPEASLKATSLIQIVCPQVPTPETVVGSQAPKYKKLLASLLRKQKHLKPKSKGCSSATET